MTSRRDFLKSAAALAALPAAASSPELSGSWQFRLNKETNWRDVHVPHTWQTDAPSAGYLGVAWYRKVFDAPSAWKGQAVRIEFEAVYHTALVTLNGMEVGRHDGKGYTAFMVDVTKALKPGAANTLEVRVDNSFRTDILPRDNSYDWTPDGGIIRPVNILVTPHAFIERVDVDAAPDLAANSASIEVLAAVRNLGTSKATLNLSYEIIDESTGRIVASRQNAGSATLNAGESREVKLTAVTLSEPRLWHFDHPNLYRAIVRTANQQCPATFGIRKFEVKNAGFYLNGERVWLMGAERMAGSNPQFGMAEPEWWIKHDHDDMKELNCVFTRVHWAQDRRVLDYCDRNGMLIQLEVPTWGPGTFKGMTGEPSPEIMRNGLEQLRETIQRDRNHPSVFAWGLCNEVGGQNPVAKQFVRQMFKAAKKLDPVRPLTYASNSLGKTPENDISGEMDFISWNEYWESWYKGSIDDMRRNLEAIHKAFPDKPIVVSEYGYCECTVDRLAGDAERIRILRTHDGVFRDYDYVGGLIFFDYNDYRTHMGDKGLGALKQRVHGVVDLYGNRKPSFEALRRESSPIESLDLRIEGAKLAVTVRTRKRIPAYVLTGYKLRCIVFGFGGLPMEQYEAALPRLTPGSASEQSFPLKDASRVRVDILRPTGFSALTATQGKVG